MKKTTKLFLNCSLVMPFLFSCGGASNSKYYVTFHQDGMEDLTIEFNSKTLQSEIEIQEPNLLAKDGYTVSWEDYTIDGKTASFTVNAIYTPITYYASFKSQGTLIESVPFTIDDITSDNSKLPSDREPAVPSNDWSNVYWEDYSLKLDNITINAQFDNLKKFNVTFNAGGEKVDELQIDKNSLDSEGKIKDELIPESVKNYTKKDYDVVWDFSISEAKDTTINASLSLHSYYIKFLDFKGEQVEELVPYTKDNITWESINKPNAPTLEGYDTSWEETTLTYKDDILCVNPVKEAKTFYITYEDYEEPQEVKYNASYQLKDTTSYLTKWADEDNNFFSSVGTYNLTRNVTLHLERINQETFDSDTVPSFIDLANSVNIKSIEIAKGEGLNGSNALKFVVKQADFGLKISKDYLDEVFKDSDVETLTFVAKASKHDNNFRHRTSAKNVCYEENYLKCGLEDYYKKFSFTRAMYNNHNDSTDFVIYGGNPDGGTATDMEVYIDSFIFNEGDVLDDHDTKLSFENGWVDSETNSYYTVFNSDGSLTNDKFFILGSGISNPCHDFEYKTDGISSLSFTKQNGYIALYLGAKFTQKIENSASKKIAFDIYSTVYINSNDNVKNLMDGKNTPFTNQGGFLKDHTWTTFILEAGKNITDVKDNGRFLIIQGSSAGTFYIDNIRILEAE